MNVIALALLVSLPLGSAPAPTSPQGEDGATDAAPLMLKLRSGDVLWGGIEGHSAERLRFRRVDTGGLVQLPWGLLDPEQDLDLRTALGYVDVTTEELMVTAKRIPIVGGPDLIGVIEGRNDVGVWVKTASGAALLPADRIAGPPTDVSWPALEIYTRDELYQQRLLELGDALTAEAGEALAERHWDLAQFCERTLDYANAAKHYGLAAEALPGFRPDDLERVTERAQTKAQNQEQLDFLRETDLKRRRGRFEEAFARLDDFDVRWPNSVVRADAVRLRERTEVAQERYLREEVARAWHRAIEDVAKDFVLDTSFAAAIEYAEEGMRAAVLARAHGQLARVAPSATPEDIERYFSERKGGRWHSASYAGASWLLGRERVQAGLGRKAEEEEKAEEALSERDEERRAVAERVRRYLDAQRLSTRAQGVDPGADPEAYWEAYPRRARAAFLRAYFAEASGDMQVRVRGRNCQTCGGDGALEILNTGSPITRQRGSARGRSSLTLAKCPTCHGVQFVRSVLYR